MTRDAVLEEVKRRFGTSPDYPWADEPTYAVLRHPDNQKWYGLLMRVPKQKLGLDEAGEVDILNLKCDPVLLGALRGKEGILPAYHMNKEHWFTVLLDRFSADEELRQLIDLSYQLTQSRRRPKEKR